MKIAEEVLEKHIRIVLNSYFDDVFETSEFYNVTCNEDGCGDNVNNIYSKRGYILKANDPWVYYCHNCGASTTAVKWMKNHFPVHYKNMMMEVMQNKKNTQQSNITFTKKSGASERDESEDTKGFQKLTKFPDCVKYCEDRKIPKEIYSKWYYCTTGIYYGRIVITFRNKQGRTYYYQCRSFNNKNGVKYLSRFGDHNSIYNYYNVDPELPVVILEGPIDSIFVENSIAVTGLKLKGDKLKKFKKTYFLLDNDKSAYKKASELLCEERRYVFNWIKFLKDYPCDVQIKDVNDFILKNKHGITKLTWDIIEPYFTNNPMDKMYFIVKDDKPKAKPKKSFGGFDLSGTSGCY